MNYSNLRGLLSDNASEGEKIRVLVISSRDGVIETIHTLHSLGYADVGAWSPLLPAPSEAEVMSILTKHRRID